MCIHGISYNLIRAVVVTNVRCLQRLTIEQKSVFNYSKPYFSELHMHLLFWGIPILLELLPLFVKERYGMDYYYPSNAASVCFIRTGGILKNSGGANKAQMSMLTSAISLEEAPGVFN